MRLRSILRHKRHHRWALLFSQKLSGLLGPRAPSYSGSSLEDSDRNGRPYGFPERALGTGLNLHVLVKVTGWCTLTRLRF